MNFPMTMSSLWGSMRGLRQRCHLLVCLSILAVVGCSHVSLGQKVGHGPSNNQPYTPARMAFPYPVKLATTAERRNWVYSPMGQGPGVPPRPSLVFKDIVGTSLAKHGDASVELLTVCRADDAKLLCWDPSGKPVAALTQAVTKIAAKQIVQFQINQKNRLVFLRIHDPKPGGPYFGEPHMKPGSWGLWSLNMPTTPSIADTPTDRYLSYSTGLEPSEHAIQLALDWYLPVDHEIAVPLQEGQLASWGKRSIKVTQIAFDTKTSITRIELYVAYDDRSFVPSVQLQDAQKHPFAYSRRDGIPILATKKTRHNKHTPTGLSLAVLSTSYISGNHRYLVTTRIHPSDIGFIKLGGIVGVTTDVSITPIDPHQ